MAIYRFEAKVIGRADNSTGRSVVACAAYRSGTRLQDEKYEYCHDYTQRQPGIAHTQIVTPEDAPGWAADREQLWNAVEKIEDTSTRRKTAQLAREFIPAIPHELTRDQRQDLVMGFVQKEMVERGMVADVAIHEPKEGENYHAHILCTMREIGPEGFGKKARDWNDTGLLVHWRQAWEEHCNAALEAAGETERVDCRSLADQGIDREPMPKLGVAAAAMERKGTETTRGEVVRETVFGNRIRSAVRGIEANGEVPEYGTNATGGTWWERAGSVFGHVVHSAREFWHDESSGSRGWANYEMARRQQQPERNAPEMDMD